MKDLTQLADQVNVFREFQHQRGRETGDIRHARMILQKIVAMATHVYRACGQDAMIDALVTDAGNWCHRGLATPPRL